ncbi:MAG TPA: hypothetical protein VFE21_06690 [Rubrobacteraceae bacterium]|nr:hypothetical protein [Rubrobacteraceae bacterium]
MIFWHRSGDRMALFASFMLLIFGGAAVAGTMHDLADAYPAFWFPVNLLDYAEQVSFSVFFYVFPDGRFVPRWTRWLAVAVALLFVPTIFFPNSLLNLFSLPLFIGFLGTLVFAQVYRYARVLSPAQRQQTKWVVFGFAVALTGFVGLISLGNLVLNIRQSGPRGEIIASTFIYGFLLLIPLSIGVAILRSRPSVAISRRSSTGASTAGSMTPPRRWKPSPPSCVRRRTLVC